MAVTKMKYAKIKCRECDCWALTCGIKKKVREYKTLIHTTAKRMEDKTNNNDNNKTKIKKQPLNKRTQSKRGDKKKLHPTLIPMEVVINNQNNSNNEISKKIKSWVPFIHRDKVYYISGLGETWSYNRLRQIGLISLKLGFLFGAFLVNFKQRISFWGSIAVLYGILLLGQGCCNFNQYNLQKRMLWSIFRLPNPG